MQDQPDEPDWYRYTPRLGMLREPGAKAVYCSVNANLAGGVLSRATATPPPAVCSTSCSPSRSQMERYHMNLTPTGDAYMGGGVRFLPRDFMKLGQMMLDGGTWKGKRVLSAEWARRATSPLYELRGMRYGYPWWVIDFRTAGARSAPSTPAATAARSRWPSPSSTSAGRLRRQLHDPALFTFQREYVPEWLLPAMM